MLVRFRLGAPTFRERAIEARKLVARGLDPIEADRAARKAAKPVPTFREIASLVIEDAQRKSVNAKVRYQWERHLGPAYSGPLLDRPVHEITALDVATVLRPVWRSKPEVARKLYPAIRRVFDRARVILRDEHGIAMLENQARWDDLKAMGFETPEELTKGNHPSLAHGQMPEFIAALRARKATAALALELLILTNVRTNAILQAKWPEFDLDKALWNVPLVNLKDREHRKESFEIPLSPRAVEIVKEMEKARVSAFVFPGQRKRKPLSNMAFLTLLKRMNAQPKGEQPDRSRDGMIPLQGGRKLMDAWATYCEPSGAHEKITLAAKESVAASEKHGDRPATTGVDLDVRCIVDAKPTKSRILFVQTIGRGLRTARGKDKLLILDHLATICALAW